MKSFNRSFLIGHLAHDPRLRQTPYGTLVCDFTVAVKSRHMEKGEPRDGAEYIPVSAWAHLAHQCYDRLIRGSLVHVEGHLKLNRWTDRRTRQPRSRMIVVADHVEFLGGLREGPPPGLRAPAIAIEDLGPP